MQEKHDMIAIALKAGLLYFAGVFALGFLLGGARMMLLEPTVGDLMAVIIESPIILALSWLLCRRAIERLQVPAEVSARLLMGGVALTVLLAAEYILATLMFAESPAGFLRNWLTTAGLVGLGGQIVFALFPLLQLRLPGSTGKTGS
ncbi:MAG: hypothetical protein PsegKO_06590 [Pseudohongiellaceae bacterium]|jgi:predicted Abi (CAAX) family protease